MQLTLSEQEKASVLRTTGVSYEDILSMDIEDLQQKIEKKIGKKLQYKPIHDERLIGRGAPYLYLNRIFSFDAKKLNKYIDSLR